MELSRSQKRNQKKREKRTAQKPEAPGPPDGQVDLPRKETDATPSALEANTQLVTLVLPMVAAKLAEAGEKSVFGETDRSMMSRSVDIISTILAEGVTKHRRNRKILQPDPELFFTCEWFTTDPTKYATTRAMQTETVQCEDASTQTEQHEGDAARGVPSSGVSSSSVQVKEGTNCEQPQSQLKHTVPSECAYDEMWRSASVKAEQNLRRELQLETQCKFTATQQQQLQEKTIAMYRAKKKKHKARIRRGENESIPKH